MSCLARLLSRSCGTCQRCHMNLILDQTSCGKWQCCQLNSCCKTTWISYIMRIGNLLTSALAKTIYKMSSCIISVKTEIISKVNDSALRFNVMM